VCGLTGQLVLLYSGVLTRSVGVSTPLIRSKTSKNNFDYRERQHRIARMIVKLQVVSDLCGPHWGCLRCSSDSLAREERLTLALNSPLKNAWCDMTVCYYSKAVSACSSRVGQSFLQQRQRISGWSHSRGLRHSL